MNAISVNNLSKCYRIYRKPHHRLFERLFNSKQNYHQEFWPLRNINFEIKQGESVGILGVNGAGKSTLLQILIGLLEPTEGFIETKGRVLGLLELGSGFNYALSGRDNIYINGAILGLSKENIDQKFDSIVDFAGIGKFIDQPVNTYSSGMAMRLAFAVQSSIEPDVFIIDEALAVGDEAFQRKCFTRINNMKEQGATILFVSHSSGLVTDLCDRAMLLHKGSLLTINTPKRVVDQYHRLIYCSEENEKDIIQEIVTGKEEIRHETVETNQDTPDNDYYDPNMTTHPIVKYEERGVTLSEIKVLNDQGEQVNLLVRGKEYTYSYKAHFSKKAFQVTFGMLIKTLTGIELGGAMTSHRLKAIDEINNNESYHVEFKFRCSLQPSTYFFNCGVVGVIDSEEIYLHRIIDALMIKVLPEKDLSATGLVDFQVSSSFDLVH